MTRLCVLLLAAVISACSRGPDEAALKTDVQQRIDKSFKPGLLEVAALRRQGSSPLPAAQSGAERVLVYFNATLRLCQGYDVKDRRRISPAAIAEVLGGREKGVFGVKAKENQPGDLLRVYGSGTYERAGETWVLRAAATREVSPTPADPSNAAVSPSLQRYLDGLAAEVDVHPHADPD
jgi:hypothetical protein